MEVGKETIEILDLLNNGFILVIFGFIYKIVAILYNTVVQTKENTKSISQILDGCNNCIINEKR